MRTKIYLTLSELQSGHDRQSHAENLIRFLPRDHDGRNTWLLNYGRGEEAQAMRARRGIRFDEVTQAAETTR